VSDTACLSCLHCQMMPTVVVGGLTHGGSAHAKLCFNVSRHTRPDGNCCVSARWIAGQDHRSCSGACLVMDLSHSGLLCPSCWPVPARGAYVYNLSTVHVATILSPQLGAHIVLYLTLDTISRWTHAAASERHATADVCGLARAQVSNSQTRERLYKLDCSCVSL
jgi:hypothetical protein